VEPSPSLCYDNRCSVAAGEEQVSVELECDKTEKLRAKPRAIHETAAIAAVDEGRALGGLAVLALAAALMMLVATWSGNF
jgi:hypothetical protein